MAHRSILQIMRDGGYDPKGGKPVPIEEIYESNCISLAEYKAEVERQRRLAQAGKNASAITDEELAAAALDERAIRAGIPKRCLDYAIDFTYIDAIENGDGIYIYGVQGSYKTTTACSMARAWLKSHPFGRAKFVRSTSLLTDFRDTYSGDMSEEEVMRQYANVGLLVIDDLGKEVPSAWAVSKVWELIDRRYGDSNSPTIITSQFRPDILAEHLCKSGNGEAAMAIVSRIRETFSLLDMGDVDHR